MFSPNSLLVSVSVIAGCLLIAIVPDLAGQGEPPRGSVGRFHATAVGDTQAVFVCDTITGECWYGGTSQTWRWIGKPGDDKTAKEAAIIIRR